MTVLTRSVVSPSSCSPLKLSLQKKLSFETLMGLMEGQCPVFIAPAFCPDHAYDHIADRIIAHPQVGPYVVESRFRRLGKSFYDTAKDPRLLDAYFAEASGDMQEMRELCHPFWSPLDELRCKLDEIWPWGATIATLNGRKMKAGTARVCFEGDQADAHVDSLGFDAETFSDAPVLTRQASANFYLRLPRKGGALVVWDKRLVTKEEEAAHRLLSSRYALDEEKLGRPLPPIHPNQGDLIIFDTNCPHAVRPTLDGVRVTLAVFIGYAGEGKPLSLWS